MEVEYLVSLLNYYYKNRGNLRKLWASVFHFFYIASCSGLNVSKGIQELEFFYHSLSYKRGPLLEEDHNKLKKIILKRIERMRNLLRDQSDMDKLTNCVYYQLAEKLQMNMKAIMIPASVFRKNYQEEIVNDFVFRSDTRNNIFEMGFKPRKKAQLLISEPFVSNPDAMIAFSRDFLAAAAFPLTKVKQTNIYLTYLENGFDIYRHGIDTLTSSTIGEGVNSSWAKEIGTVEDVLHRHIIAAIKVTRIQGINFFYYYCWKTFKMTDIQINPEADPFLLEKAKPILSGLEQFKYKVLNIPCLSEKVELNNCRIDLEEKLQWNNITTLNFKQHNK